ncbi:MAG TPA: 4-(cytidine 5'-diphospho)-2-C-methyl-D-erythritol kinase [Alphaproteobacteria bacterium]|nr:4-(cytidine 5'-diphospho)-2-C-methyl-D-erythritol kinase [Rhodospirillaceae bacterium]HRJ11775.1 4-(cytidine 5'-diphospho)-2-C-methyl-D-erythritol kinase [Alphaproteobacteria bacterium]
MVAKTTITRHPLFPVPSKKRGLWERMTRPDGIALTCHAKINLFLHVNGKREDGYHDLQSWVAFAEVGDNIRVRDAKQYHLVGEGPFAHLLPAMEDNLITKTVMLLADRHKQKPNVIVELTKNLPVGTGLGGGSSNAAAVARALQYMWGFEWEADDAEWLTKKLGADVPACLFARAAMVEGIGEKIIPTPDMPENCHVVIVYPGIGLETAEVFAMLTPPYTPHVEIFPEANDVFDLVKQLQDTRNDLMHPAIGLQPRILEAYRAITRQSGCLLGRMTGSGSACFGIFASDEAARAAATVIRQQEPKWWVRATRFLTN